MLMRELLVYLKGKEINSVNKIFTTVGTLHVYANITPLHFKFHILRGQLARKIVGTRSFITFCPQTKHDLFIALKRTFYGLTGNVSRGPRMNISN